MRIVAGGQTGVDRAALDAARDLGLAIGGWCPKGRLAEDGRIPDVYPLRETPDAATAQRTEWNVRDSDATLILTSGPLTGGTALTLDVARRLGRPCLVVDLAADPDSTSARAWLRAGGFATLNVAGPRESSCPGIGAVAREFVTALFDR